MEHAALYTLIGTALVALFGGGALGAVVTAYINRKLPSKDKQQDTLATISTTLWGENRSERAEADGWQQKYYNIYVTLQRMEKLATDYIKLQAKYQSALLELARFKALERASRPEAPNCGEAEDG